MKTQKFEEMNLSPEISKAIADMGFEEATPIQSQAIDIIMSGRDVLGQSQTGTGKTAAFGIPCLENIDVQSRHIQAVILSPTRELAIQISEEFKKLLKYKESIRVVPIYGGQPIERQIFALKKGAHVIIGTPGRVMDHMERKTIKMDNVKMIILDEADEMLDMGFREDIETILEKMPEDRQTILFSATMPKGILSLTKKFQTNPEHIQVARTELTVPLIDQVYYEVTERTKTEAVCRIIDMINPDLSLIFCNTKRKVDELVEQLQGRGYFAEGLHGDLKQQQRDVVMKKFRNGTLEILVATDVAARGIDVDDIEIVFNYDLPQDEEYYVHRIGRTARAGKSGKACTFVVGKEIYKLKDIMRYTNAKITKEKLPTLTDIEEKKSSKFINKIKDTIQEGHLTKYINMLEEMTTEEFSSLDVAAALMKMSLEQENGKDKVEIDFEKELSREFNGRYSKAGQGHDRSERAERYDRSGERGERYEKHDKAPRDGKKRVYDDSDMVRLFISIGKKDKVRVSDVVGALAGETGISGKVIGAIDIFDEFTFVDVPEMYVKDILTGMKNKKLKGLKVDIEPAKKSKDPREKRKK